MLALIASLVAGVVAADAAIPAVVCEIGRVALQDLPSRNPGSVDFTYYVDVDPGRPSLMQSCPELRENLPTGYLVADAAAWSRANLSAPIPGQHIPPAFIYTLGIPKISADGKSAIVEWRYECTGLCGGGLVSRYIRTSQGWRRNGERQVKWVS